MTDRLDHETCSELLRPFVLGRIDAARAEMVREHLGGCAACRDEERSLRALLTAEAPLTSSESATLRAAVLDGVRREAPVRQIDTARKRNAWRPLQVLGAAALLILGFVFVRSSLPLGGTSDSSGESAVGARAAAEVSDRLLFRRPPVSAVQAQRAPMTDSDPDTLQAEADVPAPDAAPEEGAEDAGTSGAGAAAGGSVAGKDSSGYSYKGAPPPLYVRGAGAVTDRKLRLVGRFGLPLVFFPQAFTVDDAARLQDEYLVRLAEAAETEAESRQVIECGVQVTGEQPALPALAAFGEYRGEPVFLLALGWTEAESGPLDRFMVWTWPAGDCSGIPSYRAGRIGV